MGVQSDDFPDHGGHYPDFLARQTFNFEQHPHWFVSHMGKGRSKISNRIKDVDILLEVRDVRAPFSSAQFELVASFGKNAKRLVVLNKADLVTPNVGLAIQNSLLESGQPCLLTSAVDHKNLIKIKHFSLENVKARHPRSLGVMMMLIGLPNVGKSTIINGLKMIAFNTARHQGKESKLVHGVKRTKAASNGTPGVTRDVNFFQISNQPRLYCYDTPGVSLLKRKLDLERNVKLAVLNTMPDHLAGEMYIADYLLYRLNKEGLFKYVEVCQLPGPTNDIRYLAAHLAALLFQKYGNMDVYRLKTIRGSQFFLTLFREGALGKLCLDHIPSLDEIRRLRQMQLETEPPGPWGPPCYPEAPPGLELDGIVEDSSKFRRDK